MRQNPQSTSGLSTFLEDRERLTRLAQSYVNSRAIAEELVQDAWLRWHARSYQDADARPIFRQIIVNLGRDWWRRSQTERAAVQVLAMEPDVAPSADTIVIAKEDLERVLVVLASLSPQTQAAFTMSWYEGLSMSKIAARLGISKSYAHKLVSRALTDLAVHLEA